MTTTSTNYLHYFRIYTYPLLPGDFITNTTLHIDHVSLHDPSIIFGSNFRIDQQDEQSLGLSRLNLEKIQFTHGVYDSEESVLGEEVISRHNKVGLVSLDMRVFCIFKANPVLTVQLLLKQDDVHRVFFDGTILVNQEKRRFVPALYSDVDGVLRTFLSPLERTRSIFDCSAVLVL